MLRHLLASAFPLFPAPLRAWRTIFYHSDHPGLQSESHLIQSLKGFVHPLRRLSRFENVGKEFCCLVSVLEASYLYLHGPL